VGELKPSSLIEVYAYAHQHHISNAAKWR